MVGVGVAAVVSFRLGGPDGVSVEAAKWSGSLARLGWSVRTVAGTGTADVLVPGLGIDQLAGPDPDELAAALAGVDVVVVENLCSLPLNPAAAAAVATHQAGRPTVLHHHDLPWQRPYLAHHAVPDDPCWRHVTINDLSRRELAARGITAVTIRNAFDTEEPPGDRDATRTALDLAPHERLIIQPTRAIARKNVPAAMALAEATGAVFWLLGPAEEGYGPELETMMTQARRRGLRCLHGPAGTDAGHRVAHAYAAADLVAFPSRWEGFGNPVVESAIHRRALAISRYPVALELAGYGFRWLDAFDPSEVDNWWRRPDPSLLEHNLGVARRWFSLPCLDDALRDLLASLAVTAAGA